MTLMLEGKKRNGTLMLQDSTGQVSEDGGPPRRVSGCVRKGRRLTKISRLKTPLTLIKSLFPLFVMQEKGK